MKRALLFSGIFFCHLFSFSQSVHVTSFQHIVRWVNEVNFPPYITQDDVRDSVRQVVSDELGRHFKIQEVVMPADIEYRYISEFGKAAMKQPAAAGNAGDYQVAVYSFITRATVGFAVNWKLKVVANQNGKTVYTRETEHEIEYFSPSGYMTAVSWYSEESFIKIYRELFSELLENSNPLPGKIVLGSPEEKEKEVRMIIPDPGKLLLKTNGNFLQAGNFTLSLHNDKDSLATVIYRDGWDASSGPLINMSEIGASLLSDLTGLRIGYNTKSKQKRFGRINYADGREIKLRMEWVEVTQRVSDGSVDGSYVASPMVAEAYEQKELVAYFTFMSLNADVNVRRNMMAANVNPGQMMNYKIQGKIGDYPVIASYNSQNGFIELSEDGKVKVIVNMQNLNPASNSFSGTRMSKNKKTMTGSSSGVGSKPRSGEPEWYPFYHVPELSEREKLRYLDVILCLFFGMGNQN